MPFTRKFGYSAAGLGDEGNRSKVPFLLNPVNSPEQADNESLRALLRDYKSQTDFTWSQVAKKVFEASSVIKEFYKAHSKSDAIELLQRRLSDFKTSETDTLPAEIADSLLEYFCHALPTLCPQLIRQSDYYTKNYR